MRLTRLAALLLLVGLAVASRHAEAHDGLSEQIAVLTARIAAEPARADLYLRRGDLRRASGDLTQARIDLDRASALDSRLTGVHLALARLHMDEHHPVAAVVAATTYLAGEPDNVQALLLRARAFAQLRKRQQAAADFTRAINLQPVPDLVVERARLMEEQPADLEEALAGVEDGIRRIGPVVTLDIEALEIERRLQRYDAALRRVDDIAARSPRKEQWLARRGSLLEEAGRASEAIAAYRAALKTATALPPRVRNTRATSALISELQTSIDRLTARASSASTGRSASR